MPKRRKPRDSKGGQPDKGKPVPSPDGQPADSAWREWFELTAPGVYGKSPLLARIAADIPWPEDGFPLLLEEFLELLMPSQRGPKRMAAYRRFLMAEQDLDATQAERRLVAQKPEEMKEWEVLRRAFLFLRWLKADLGARRNVSGEAGRQSRLAGEQATEQEGVPSAKETEPKRPTQTESKPPLSKEEVPSPEGKRAIRKAQAQWDEAMRQHEDGQEFYHAWQE